MTLFELYATLGLDTTDFATQAEAARLEGETLAEDVKEAFDTVDTAASDADTSLDDLQTKSTTTQAIFDGFMNAAGDVVQDLIEGIIEFGAQSIDAAAGTGSEMAGAFLESQDALSTSVDALKLKVGNVLLPAATMFNNFASAMLGVTDSDRLLVMLDQIDSYAFANITNLQNTLGNVFGMFETVEYAESPASVEDMLSGLKSQTEYWEQYAATLESLQQRGVDASFLAEIADGTVESLATLKALEAADTKQLDALMESYAAVQETKEGAVAGLSELQLSVDADFQAMQDSVEELVIGMDQSVAAQANAALTGQGVANGLASAYPSIAGWVSTINATLSQIGAGYDAAAGATPMWWSIIDAAAKGAAGYDMGIAFAPHASGLPYVPYDDYRASLHAGEAVLTRQDAEEWRSGQRGAGVSASDLAAAIRGELSGMVVQMDGIVVGRLVTDTVSKEIARRSR